MFARMDARIMFRRRLAEPLLGLAARDLLNIVDTEDALKYSPSLFLRRRNNGTVLAPWLRARPQPIMPVEGCRFLQSPNHLTGARSSASL